MTKEQHEQIAGREECSLRIFSGNVYARQPNGSVVCIDPDGKITDAGKDMPRKGITLRESEASDKVIRSVMGLS